MSRNCIEDLLIELLSVYPITFALDGDYMLECFKCLDCSFETDRAWFHVVLTGGLSHNRADEIVSQDVRPDFLSY